MEENNTPISSIEAKPNLAMPIAIVLAGIIIAGAIYFGGGSRADGPSADSANFNKPLKVDIKNVATDKDPYIGDPNAPVVMAYWADYQCPACKAGDETIISPLVADYIKSGKVKVVFKDFAFLSPDSLTIGIIGRAVWEAYPDKYYAWHRSVFDNQGKEGASWASKASILKLTSEVEGVDITIIQKLIEDNGKIYQQMMDDNKAEGASFGINATPSIIIADQLIIGVPQYAQFKAFIDDLLK